MRVLIFEPGFGGHRLTTARRLIQALKALPVDVVVATSPAAPESVEWSVQLHQQLSEVVVDPSVRIVSGTPLQWAWSSLRALQAAWRQHQVDHIIVPVADGIAQFHGISNSLGIFRPPPGVEIEGLMMRGGFGYPESVHRRGEVMRRASAIAALRAPWTSLHHLDPFSASYLLHQSDSMLGHKLPRVVQMPDAVEVPVMDSCQARRVLGLPEEGRYLVCAGGLSPRKGVDKLIRAFAVAPLGASDRLLLAGRASPEIRAILDSESVELVAQNRIICIDRYLSENEFAAALGAANLVVTPYPDHLASASIVIAAAAAKRPVLGSDKGWIGRIVPFFDLGWTSLVSESRVFGEAIRMALDAAKDYCATEMTRRFVAFHTVQNMRLTWTQRIRERLGIATGTMNCSWDWVVTGHSSSVSMSVPQDLNNKAQTCP